ncbi:MAG: polysaccharide biosynthesis protein, partial [Inhella sp.]
PVRINELARSLIQLSGHGLDEIRIEFSGLRPGEKLFEELLADADTTLPTAWPALRLARLQDGDAVRAVLPAVTALLPSEAGDARAWLARVVPEYRPA